MQASSIIRRPSIRIKAIVTAAIAAATIYLLIHSDATIKSTISEIDHPVEVCIQLDWLHQARFAGLYIADKEGYYREENLSVRLVEGGADIDWQKRLHDPLCPIGIGSPGEIVQARAAGVPIKAVAAIDQISPVVIITRKASGIWDPRQLKGLTVATVPDSVLHLAGMLEKVGLRYSDIKQVKYSPEMTRLYRGSVDAWTGNYADLIADAKNNAVKINIIHPADYGIQIYDDIIYVREEFIESSPLIVDKFLRATFKGWMKAIQNPQLGARETLAYSSTLDTKEQAEQLHRSIPYMHTGEVPLGWMEGRTWDDIVSLAYSGGLIDSRLEAAEMYNLEFLRRLYGERH